MNQRIDPNEADATVKLSDGFPVLVRVTGFDVPASHATRSLPANHPDCPDAPDWTLYLIDGSPAPKFVWDKIDGGNEIRINAALDDACIDAAIDAAESRAEYAAYMMEDR